MNIYLEGSSLTSAVFSYIPLKSPAFILTLEMSDYHLLINGVLCLTVILMVVLLAVMMKSLSSLKDSAVENKEKGKVWIEQKLFDFDAEQLKILIKKINKTDKDDKQVETKN